MAYIMNSLKKISFRSKKRALKKEMFDIDDKIFIFIVALSAIVIAVDYALVMKFMDILKNI